MGNGGREHALAWKISYSSQVLRIYMIPGNGGTTQLKNAMNVEHVVTREDLRNFLLEEQIDLVVIGPEQPLVEGLSDELRKWGIACFGPSQKAALLEGSKAFSKRFMQTHNIPTAKFNVSWVDFLSLWMICMFIYTCVERKVGAWIRRSVNNNNRSINIKRTKCYNDDNEKKFHNHMYFLMSDHEKYFIISYFLCSSFALGFFFLSRYLLIIRRLLIMFDPG